MFCAFLRRTSNSSFRSFHPAVLHPVYFDSLFDRALLTGCVAHTPVTSPLSRGERPRQTGLPKVCLNTPFFASSPHDPCASILTWTCSQDRPMRTRGLTPGDSLYYASGTHRAGPDDALVNTRSRKERGYAVRERPSGSFPPQSISARSSRYVTSYRLRARAVVMRAARVLMWCTCS